MKNLFLKLTVASLLFIAFSTTSLAFYEDVSETHPYFKAIESLHKAEKLPETDTYNPDALIRLDDLYAILSKYTGTDITPPSTNLKITISVTKAIKLLKDANVDTSYLENLNPTHKRMSKGEFAEYLYQIDNYKPGEVKKPTLKIIPINITAKSKYTDVENELLENDEFKKLLDMWSIIQNEYLYKEDLDNDTLIKGAVKGFADGLKDPYTNYQSEKEANSFKDTFSGHYEGVGMSVDLIDNNVTVITPLKNSPAEKAGLLPNDVIVEVNGENVLGKALLYVTSKIKGPSGTSVEMVILRGTEEITFQVKRETIIRASVNHEIKKNGNKKIGYINVVNFGATTYEEFTQAANALIKDSPDGILIDLRNNPGGYLNTAVDIIGLFDRKVRTAAKLKYANGKEIVFETSGNGLLADYRTVILVNKGSASASEILAGALQDYGKASVVGEYTFGKGTAQSLREYSDGAVFKYTNAKWLTPNGRDIDKKGIRPNTIIKNSTNKDLQIEKALTLF